MLVVMTFSNSCFSCLLWLATYGHVVIGQKVKMAAGRLSYGVEGLLRCSHVSFISSWFVGFTIHV